MNIARDPFVVALTGGIASGKSAVTRRFEAHGIAVYDADIAARDVVRPGSEGLAAIAEAFGDEVIDSNGSLNRARMRQIVFADDHARKVLERITHPRVRAWLRDHVTEDRGPYCMLAIPLLAENRDQYRWVDRVLVVDAPVALQLQRLVKRDGIDETLAQRMIDRQASREKRLDMAHDVIVNDGEEAQLDAQVEALHQRYLALAASR